MLIDAPLGTNFPEKVANMPKVSNRRLRDTAIIDVVDNKPFDVPASWSLIHVNNVAPVFHVQLMIWKIKQLFKEN